YNI
ncbi:hypothetical protein CPC698_0606B, partial [Chlamydia psittaci C6/98]